jgi:hypothetical protein
MATVLQSPGIVTIEQNETLRIPSVTSSIGAIVVAAEKGPINVVTLVTDEQDYVNTFGKPDDVNYPHFFTSSAFLGGSNKLYVVRTENTNTLCAGATVGLSGANLTILPTQKPVADYPLSYDNISAHEAVDGNIELLDSEMFHVYAVGAGPYYDGVTVSIISALDYDLLKQFKEEISQAVSLDDLQQIGETWYNGTPGTTATPAKPYLSTSPLLRDELIDINNNYSINTTLLAEYVSFETGPTINMDTSVVPATAFGVANQDKFAIYVWSPAGSLVEQYIVSKDVNSVDSQGNRDFGPLVINGSSSFVYFFIDGSEAGADGVIVQSTGQFNLMGADALSSSLGNLTGEISEQWFNHFTNKETLEIDLLLDPGYVDDLKRTLDFISGQIRKDSFSILSMPASKMFNISNSKPYANAYTLMKEYVQGGDPLGSLNINSSYSAIYGQYFNIYDKYNQVNRWVPVAGYVGQIIANVDFNNAQWWAPAGLNRGIISGINAVAINPNQAQRDVMYSNRINPIPNFFGQGVVIWGQKTLSSAPTAFDRINVRRLFLNMERSIEKMARFLVFEFNDDFTRARFASLANSFLSGIKAQRGITDYKVICDTSNNTADVIDNNEFVAQIMVKPNRVAEFITLKFTAVSTGVSFSEVVSNG